MFLCFDNIIIIIIIIIIILLLKIKSLTDGQTDTRTLHEINNKYNRIKDKDSTLLNKIKYSKGEEIIPKILRNKTVD